MSSYENYFKIYIYDGNWDNLVETSTFVFQDKISKFNISDIIYILYHLVFNHNLEDIEFFLRLTGYSAFNSDEMPDSIAYPESIILNTQRDIQWCWGNIKTREDAITFVEESLGKGIIDYFYKVKENQICHQNVKLYEQIEQNNNILKRIRELKKQK